MKAASPRGSVSLGAVACELMKTMPCARGSPLLAPRASFRRAGMRCVSEDGASRRCGDACQAAVGAVGRAPGDVSFRVFFFWAGCSRWVDQCRSSGLRKDAYSGGGTREGWVRRTHGSTGNGRQPMPAVSRRGPG